MEKRISYTYWLEEDGKYLGYLNQYPDHWTQGEDLIDLRDHLKDLYELFKDENIPGIKKIDEFTISI